MLLVAINAVPLGVHAQTIDTVLIRREIEALSNKEQIQRYLDNMMAEDQKYRGKQTNDSIDLAHLVSISYFTNKFGYPQQKEFGHASSVPWAVWIHSKYQYKDQQTDKYFEVKGDKLEYIHQGEVWKEYKKQVGI